MTKRYLNPESTSICLPILPNCAAKSHDCNGCCGFWIYRATECGVDGPHGMVQDSQGGLQHASREGSNDTTGLQMPLLQTPSWKPGHCDQVASPPAGLLLRQFS